MKKTLILTLLLASVTIAGSVYAASDILSQRDQIIYHQNILSGSPAAASGLSVSLKLEEKYHYFWEASMELHGDARDPETDVTGFRFSHIDDTISHIGASDPYETAVRMQIAAGVSWEKVDSIEPDVIPERFHGLASRWTDNELGIMEETIPLSQVYTYYPINGGIRLPDFEADWFNQIEHYVSKTSEGWDAGAASKKLEKAFNSFFRIPVLPSEELRLEIRTAGSQYELICDQISDETFDFNVKSALTEDAVYFTFDAHTSRKNQKTKNLADTSQIGGGFGIYRLTFQSLGLGEDGPQPELATAYVLNPEAEILELDTDANGTRLILHTREDGIYTLTIIEAETMELLQKLSFPSLQDVEGTAAVVYGDGWIILGQHRQEYILLAEDDREFYETALHLELGQDWHPWESEGSQWLEITSDGSRIAIASPFNDFFFGGTDFFLQIYGADGLEYHGVYESSLTAEGKGSFSRLNDIELNWGE